MPIRKFSSPLGGAPGSRRRLQEAAKRKGLQPGVRFELQQRIKGGATMGDVAKLRRAARKGDKSAQKSLRKLEEGLKVPGKAR